MESARFRRTATSPLLQSIRLKFTTPFVVTSPNITSHSDINLDHFALQDTLPLPEQFLVSKLATFVVGLSRVLEVFEGMFRESQFEM